MAAVNKKIVISGYYGFQNSGDEAVLQSILLAIRSVCTDKNMKIEPIILSANPTETENQYGVKAVSRTNLVELIQTLRNADGLISGGGSLLQDVTSMLTIPYYLGVINLAQWLKKPVFIYAQGVGPVNRSMFQLAIRSAFNKSVHISVRDEESLKWLSKIGVTQPIDLVPDPVMSMPLPENDVNRQPAHMKRIAISVRFWKQNTDFLDRLAEALNHLLTDPAVELMFLPFHVPADEQASLYVIDRLHPEHRSRIHLKTILDPRQMLGEVSESRLLIGMRLHSLIYAANQQVPMVGISYDPKIDQFLARLNMKPAATTEQFEVDDVVNQSIALLGQADHWRSEKLGLLAELKSQANKPAEAICDYYLNKG